MKSNLNHIQINIDYKNISFYKDLLKELGWTIIVEAENILGFESGSTGSLWFLPRTAENQNNYNSVGVNHIGIGTDSVASVDKAVYHLKNKGVSLLFDTPRHRPEFGSDQTTYYQVMFESPDKILWEIMYSGKK
ncbi:MAG: VOC family protein [Patescibacteria group bacterium]